MFQLDEFNTDVESFSVGAPCTVSTEDGMFTNRIHTGGAVCFAWNTCNGCGDASPDDNDDTDDGDNMDDGSMDTDGDGTTFCVDMNNFNGCLLYTSPSPRD